MAHCHPKDDLVDSFKNSVSFLLAIQVGSEEARVRAGLRPPLKLHGRFYRMQLSQRLTVGGMPAKELTRPS
jgi:hypothetical protein